MKKRLIKKRKSRGAILIGAVLTAALLVGLGVALTSLVIISSVRTQRSYLSIASLSYAEAVIEKTMWELNNGVSPTCTPNCSFTNAYVTLDINNIDTETKELIAEAFVPNYTNYKAKKKIKVRISTTPDVYGIAFNYAIQSGSGGIEIRNSAEVKGNLYSNGDVSVSAPAKVKDPGNVWAVGSISDPSGGIQGTKNPGAPTIPLPQIDLQAWIDIARTGGTIIGNYSPPASGTFTDLGPKEITGNFSMSTSSQKINLLGPLYIHGDLVISGGEWKIDDSLGSNGTMVLVDGKISVSGSAKFTKNSFDTYILFVSTNTASSSSNPAISFSSSAEVKSAAFYAYNGSMKFTGSGEIIAMTGQTLYIDGNGEIEYKSGLASANFAGGPGGIWRKKSWQELKKL